MVDHALVDVDVSFLLAGVHFVCPESGHGVQSIPLLVYL
jgi:hypothetical protein